jgi:very-short-patch-repair endonuclease
VNQKPETLPLSYYTEITRELHPTKNGNIDLDKISSGSTRKLWWKCQFGHEWKTQVRYRIANKAPRGRSQGCPYCNSPFSSLEALVYVVLKQIFFDAQWRKKINRMEIDVFLPSLQIGIEIDGFHWHSVKKQQDIKKNDTMKKRGIKVIRLRESPLGKIEEHDIVYNRATVEKDIVLILLEEISKFIKSKISRVNWKKAFAEYELLKKSTIPLERSLMYKFPKIAQEWNYSMNGGLCPENVSYGSKRKVWWICKKNNRHRWATSVCNRTGRNSGCPFCSGRKPTRNNNFARAFPRLIEEWHEDNALSPWNVSPKSHNKVKWICSYCGLVYTSAVSERARGRGCPHCRYVRMARTRRSTNNAIRYQKSA